jgi:dihydroxyacid dehydratase/phosphogluconate dehydratase
VLVGDTVVPAWHYARTSLPRLFAATSALSAGGYGMLCAPAADAHAARRLAMIGGVSALLALERVHVELGPRQRQAYERDQAQTFSQAARILTVTGTAAAVFAKNSNVLGKIAGALLLAGGLAERFAIFRAGCVSAKDPAFTIDAQRNGSTPVSLHV